MKYFFSFPNQKKKKIKWKTELIILYFSNGGKGALGKAG